MNLGQLLFQTEGELAQRNWWFAQIFIWAFSALTLCIYMKFGFHDALFTSVLWLVFFWWKTNVNIKRLRHRGHHGWGIFCLLLWFEFPVVGWLSGFLVMGILGKKPEKKDLILQ